MTKNSLQRLTGNTGGQPRTETRFAFRIALQRHFCHGKSHRPVFGAAWAARSAMVWNAVAARAVMHNDKAGARENMDRTSKLL